MGVAETDEFWKHEIYFPHMSRVALTHSDTGAIRGNWRTFLLFRMAISPGPKLCQGQL